MSGVRDTRARFGVFRPVFEEPFDPMKQAADIIQHAASSVSHLVDQTFRIDNGQPALALCGTKVETPWQIFPWTVENAGCWRCKSIHRNLERADAIE